MTALRRDLSSLLAGRPDWSVAWQPPEWYGQALCAQTDYEAFFPEKGGSVADAMKTCALCPVRDECREYALANDERFGIWGGLTETDRRKYRQRTKRELKAAS